jgi:hypothetical protein
VENFQKILNFLISGNIENIVFGNSENFRNFLKTGKFSKIVGNFEKVRKI